MVNAILDLRTHGINVMTHVFLLIGIPGWIIVSKDMHFEKTGHCLYFAKKLTDQPPVPNANAMDGDSKFVNYVAVCKPIKVNPKTTKVY